MTKTWEELPRKLTPALKKRISNDWHTFFPELAVVKPLLFRKRVGCLAVSLFLQISRGSEDYLPVYCVRNLAKEQILMSALLFKELRTLRTNAPDHIKVRWHDKNYREAASRMRSQAYLPLEGPISLQNVIKAYQNYMLMEPWMHIIDCLEDPAMICAWAGEPELAKDCLAWGLEVFKTWPSVHHEAQGGVESWHDKMLETISDPERLRQITRDQVVFHKLTKIPYQDFSDASYKELP